MGSTVRRSAATPSAEVGVALMPTEDGVALTVHGPVDHATFPLVRAALVTAAAGAESLTVDLRGAALHGDDVLVLLAVLERRMRRFGRHMHVLTACSRAPVRPTGRGATTTNRFD